MTLMQLVLAMIRITDPKKSIPFYTNVLGMKLVFELPMPAGKFTNYFGTCDLAAHCCRTAD